MEVTLVAGRNDQLMNARCGSDHDVFEQVIRLALHEPCRFAEALSIHGQDLERLRQLVNPYFDLRSFRGILAPGAFHTCLELADGHSGQVNLICLQQFYPCQHSAVRLRFSQLGDHVGVKQAVSHRDFTGGRRRNIRRSGTRFSKRGSGQRRRVLRFGREDACKRAPFVDRHKHRCRNAPSGHNLRAIRRVRFSSSLNRAFASCTCHSLI
jgi:hypothetical protein